MTRGGDAAWPALALDHLVVAARTLEEGVAWCEATLGVVPAPGGRHALMSTHNRLIDISSPSFPRTFLEIVAIDPSAPSPGRSRWFDLDSLAMQRVLDDGPRLVHWVARTDDITASAALLRRFGHDPGTAALVERMTPRGMLRWQITLRGDGARPADGAVPLLIEWGDTHPCDTLPRSGVTIERIEIGGVPAALVTALGVDMPGTGSVASTALSAVVSTPSGRVRLDSPFSRVDPLH